MKISRILGSTLGLLGGIALVLAIWSSLDGDWLPLAVLAPGIGAYGFGFVRRF